MTDMAHNTQLAGPDEAISRFAGPNAAYYDRAFRRIGSANRPVWTFNATAALLGPLWAAARGLWGLFGVLLTLEVMALVQVGRGLFGDLGAEETARAEQLAARAAQMRERAEQAAAEGKGNAEALAQVADNMTNAAGRAAEAATAAGGGALATIIVGLAAWFALRVFAGWWSNVAYERRYQHWRVSRHGAVGLSMQNAAIGVLLTAVIAVPTLYRFVVAEPATFVTDVPVDRDLYNALATWLDVDVFDALARAWGGFFDGITAAIRAILEALEVVLVETPWFVVMTGIVALAWRLAGARIAVFTGAGLAYLALFGFWEKSMITVALLGTAALICILVGIPLGIACGKNARLYAALRPVLDFMQTMPSFVYLIPVIAFFGTGKPAGILATIIFGLPPVVRLTALGIREVPGHVKEAATAFGAQPRKLLWAVELPLAAPSIMTGVNQTILLCLGMVVIASLIGAEGLGQDVLVALQYASKGEGLLAGLAILVCAMIIDRIVQGAFEKPDKTEGR